MRKTLVSKAKKQILVGICISMMLSAFLPAYTHAGSLPDVSIYYIATVDSVIQGERLDVTVRIQNTGTKNISAGTVVTNALLIDNVVVATNSFSTGLSVNGLRYLNLTWVASLGSTQYRNLQVRVDYQNTIEESDETNNVYERTIEVVERATDISIDGDIYIAGVPRVGVSVPVFVSVINLGKNTTKSINVSFYVNASLKQHQIVEGLARNSVVNLSFSWMPVRFGSHMLKIVVDPQNVVAEHTESNNEKTRVLVVRESRLAWWNTSWHYRQFFNVSGAGNMSYTMNFTQLLNDLQVVGKTFDNTSIRVIQYASTGAIHSVVTNFTFHESPHYNASTNARGTLFFKVDTPSYFYVYFDVVENTAPRVPVVELESMQQSGNPYIHFVGMAEGWWIDAVHPIKSFYLPTQKMNITMRSTAHAVNVSARLYKEGVYQEKISLQTTDNIIWSAEKIFSAAQKGNWTLSVSGFDIAGYKTEQSLFFFYVGTPDLECVRVNITSDFPQGSPVYEGSTVLITTQIITRYASVDDVNISCYVNNVYSHLLSKSSVDLMKGSNTVSMSWYVAKKGSYTLEVRVDPLNMIPEVTTTNNNRSILVVIEGKPDLGFSDLYFINKSVDVGDQVEFFAVIQNTGRGKAVNYRVNLYLESNKKYAMNYTAANLKNFTLVSLEANESKTISLIWKYAVYGSFGEWSVAVQAVTDAVYPDMKPENNTFLSKKQKLLVNKPEENPPVIHIQALSTYERRSSVPITAVVTDASGIHSVMIMIKNPTNRWFNTTMTASGADTYRHVFTQTEVIGVYTVLICAVDASVFMKKTCKNTSFTVVEDQTPPTVSFYAAFPVVQLTGQTVEIRCIVSDPSGVEFVGTTLRYPDGSLVHQTMTSRGNSTYVFDSGFNRVGRYAFLITARDSLGNEHRTQEKEFWVTYDVNDTDSDGLPDAWELLYGFDPRNSSDAFDDADGDGFTNLQEYSRGFNPRYANVWSDGISRQVQKHAGYLFVSCLLFGVIIGLVWFGLRRMNS